MKQLKQRLNLLLFFIASARKISRSQSKTLCTDMIILIWTIIYHYLNYLGLKHCLHFLNPQNFLAEHHQLLNQPFWTFFLKSNWKHIHFLIKKRILFWMEPNTRIWWSLYWIGRSTGSPLLRIHCRGPHINVTTLVRKSFILFLCIMQTQDNKTLPGQVITDQTNSNHIPWQHIAIQNSDSSEI